MQDLIFIGAFFLSLVTFSIRAFIRLPREGGQFLAAMPRQHLGSEVWHACNLTRYGLYNAVAYVLAAAITFILLGSIGIPALTTTVVFFTLVAVCVPSSRIMAQLVEGKPHTLTVGGASFVGILLAPWIVMLASQLAQYLNDPPFPILPILAAFAIAYAFGEGVGRLACISFGCCYGRPIASLPQPWQRWLTPLAFRFSGHTRKVAYAGQWENIPLVPIQAITNILYLVTGTVAFWLFLQEYYLAACLTSLLITQLWRVASEGLRADFRGNLRFSAYQRMSLASILYLIVLLPRIPIAPDQPRPHLTAGLLTIWQPGILLALQALFVFAFLFTGRSSVTAATIKFYVRKEQV